MVEVDRTRATHPRVPPEGSSRRRPHPRQAGAGGPGHPEVRAAGRERAGVQAGRLGDRERAGQGRRVEHLPDEQDLFITKAYVDEGTTLKRFQPRAQGRAFQIKKRTSHITVVLATPDEARGRRPRRRRASNGPEE